MKNKVVVISGASSGVGREIALTLTSNNYKVYNLSRRASNINGVIDIKCDITNEEDVKNSFNIISNKEKSIDVLINNSGFGISGPIEYTDISDSKRQFEVNFFGHHLVTTYFLKLLKDSGGKILFTSSLAALFSIPFQSFYSASKSSIESYAKALSSEVKSFNIEVAYIRLGDTKTDFTKNRNKLGEEHSEYKTKSSVHKMEIDEEKGMDPKVISKKYLKIIKKKHIKIEYTIGFSNKLLVFLSKILPVNLANKIVRKLYVK